MPLFLSEAGLSSGVSGCSIAEPTERVSRRSRACRVQMGEPRCRGGKRLAQATQDGMQDGRDELGVSGQTSFPMRTQNCLQTRSEPP